MLRTQARVLESFARACLCNNGRCSADETGKQCKYCIGITVLLKRLSRKYQNDRAPANFLHHKLPLEDSSIERRKAWTTITQSLNIRACSARILNSRLESGSTLLSCVHHEKAYRYDTPDRNVNISRHSSPFRGMPSHLRRTCRGDGHAHFLQFQQFNGNAGRATDANRAFQLSLLF